MSTPPPVNQKTTTTLEKLEEEIIVTNPGLFNGIPKDRAKQIVQRVAVSIKSHSGPLPDAETLAQYNEIIPDGANRIMIGFEKQLEHRISIENVVIRSQANQGLRGQWFAFVIALFVLAASFYLILSGFEIAGTVLGSIDLVALVAVFITGKMYQSKNLSEKK